MTTASVVLALVAGLVASQLSPPQAGATPQIQSLDWSTPVELSDAGQDAVSPQVTSSDDGMNNTAVWVRNNSSGTSIVQASSRAGAASTWSSPVNLSITGGGAADPHVEASTDGAKLAAVWVRHNGSNGIVQTARSTTSGATWAAPTNLSANGQSASTPRVVASDDGIHQAVVWSRFDGTASIVQVVTSSDGGASWGAVHDLSAGGENAVTPAIVSSADGSKLSVVWSRFDGTNLIVQAAASTDGGGGWSSGSSLSAAGRDADSPALVSAASGDRVIALWSRYDGSNNVIQSAVSTNAGIAWSSPHSVSEPGLDAVTPQLAASASGTSATAAWIGFNGSNTVVLAAELAPDLTSWTSPIRLSATGQDVAGVDVATSGSGARSVVVWNRFDGANQIVQESTGAPAPPPASKNTQWPLDGCVRTGKIPKNGTHTLIKAGCRTNAGQVVGVTVSAKQRGDLRYFKLFCKTSGNKQPRTSATGYSSGSQFCKKGPLMIKTKGLRLRLTVTWAAPETSAFLRYKTVRTYRT